MIKKLIVILAACMLIGCATADKDCPYISETYYDLSNGSIAMEAINQGELAGGGKVISYIFTIQTDGINDNPVLSVEECKLLVKE